MGWPNLSWASNEEQVLAWTDQSQVIGSDFLPAFLFSHMKGELEEELFAHSIMADNHMQSLL